MAKVQPRASPTAVPRAVDSNGVPAAKAAAPNHKAYHHGDLRCELIQVGLQLLSEVGVAGFSVTQAARRAGVSPAAPYRHFPDRRSLLVECATVLTKRLADVVETAVALTRDDPVERLAAAAGAYTDFVIQHGVGYDLIFADGFADARFTELHAQSRRLLDILLRLANATAPNSGFLDTLDLLEAVMATAHGYAQMEIQGGFAQFQRGNGRVRDRAISTVRIVIAGMV